MAPALPPAPLLPAFPPLPAAPALPAFPPLPQCPPSPRCSGPRRYPACRHRSSPRSSAAARRSTTCHLSLLRPPPVAPPVPPVAPVPPVDDVSSPPQFTSATAAPTNNVPIVTVEVLIGSSSLETGLGGALRDRGGAHDRPALDPRLRNRESARVGHPPGMQHVLWLGTFPRSA